MSLVLYLILLIKGNMELQKFEDNDEEFLVINRNFVPKRPVDEESGLLQDD